MTTLIFHQVGTVTEVESLGLSSVLEGFDPASPNIDFDVPCSDTFSSVCNIHLEFDDFALVSDAKVDEIEDQMIADIGKGQI